MLGSRQFVMKYLKIVLTQKTNKYFNFTEIWLAATTGPWVVLVINCMCSAIQSMQWCTDVLWGNIVKLPLIAQFPRFLLGCIWIQETPIIFIGLCIIISMMEQKSQSCSPNNISVEKAFDHLDQKLRFCPNITTPAIEGSVMFSINRLFHRYKLSKFTGDKPISQSWSQQLKGP